MKTLVENIKKHFVSKHEFNGSDLTTQLSDIQNQLKNITEELGTVDDRIQDAISNMSLKTLNNKSIKGNGNLNFVGVIVRDQGED